MLSYALTLDRFEKSLPCGPCAPVAPTAPDRPDTPGAPVGPGMPMQIQLLTESTFTSKAFTCLAALAAPSPQRRLIIPECLKSSCKPGLQFMDRRQIYLVDPALL